jgi:FKBP-type peptidyl-prolyl cis-trans isomerase FkpA
MKRFFVFLSAVVLFLSCSKHVDPCKYDACAIAAPASEIAQVEAYLSSASITTATKHCSGMYYIIDAAGSGATANICNTVAVKYKGQLTNGTVFDQSTSAVGFQLNGLIEAWKKGIPLIKPGGKIRLYCPPSLAYGNQAVGTIPANSILIFEIELTNVY